MDAGFLADWADCARRTWRTEAGCPGSCLSRSLGATTPGTGLDLELDRIANQRRRDTDTTDKPDNADYAQCWMIRPTWRTLADSAGSGGLDNLAPRLNPLTQQVLLLFPLLRPFRCRRLLRSVVITDYASERRRRRCGALACPRHADILQQETGEHPGRCT
eukprot:gene18036-biopygen11130